MVKRFEVYLINLDEEVSDDPKNSRPGVVISPDEIGLDQAALRRLIRSIVDATESAVASRPQRKE